MSWHFRKVFKLFSGVKLNLTQRQPGLTIGASPLSLNVGPRGVYRNIDIPGTGIWSRKRLDAPPRRERNAVQPSLEAAALRDKIQRLESAKQALEAYGKAHADLAIRSGEILTPAFRASQIASLPRETSRPYMISINTFFDAAKELQGRAETLETFGVDKAAQAKFNLWLVEMKQTCEVWVKQAQSGEAVGEAFGKFLALAGPAGGDAALEFLKAVDAEGLARELLVCGVELEAALY